MRVVLDDQNKLPLEIHQLDGMANLSVLWDSSARLNKCTNLFNTGHANVNFRCVIIDNLASSDFTTLRKLSSLIRWANLKKYCKLK